MPKIDVDQLYSVARDKAAVVANEALFPIQDEHLPQQIVGVATLFAAFCNRVGLDPQQVHGIGMRVLRHEDFHHKGNVQIETLRDFAGIKIDQLQHRST